VERNPGVKRNPGVERNPGVDDKGMLALQESDLAKFESLALPHLDAAYTLARYLLRDPDNAEDAVQEAFLRALKYFGSYRGGDPRAWILAIVRNECRSKSPSRRDAKWAESVPFDEEIHTAESISADALALETEAKETIREALDLLPIEFREVVILREIQGLSYQEIADIVKAPIGTIMSRLSRGRARLEKTVKAGHP
jgi:RNA polymerase sigma-70 factor (ECF subfamily)